MNYLTATDARKIADDKKKFKHLGTVLTTLLDNIKRDAGYGQTEYIGEGYGMGVDLQALTEALQQLGYNVQDISHKPTPGGNVYLGRSLKISW